MLFVDTGGGVWGAQTRVSKKDLRIFNEDPKTRRAALGDPKALGLRVYKGLEFRV